METRGYVYDSTKATFNEELRLRDLVNQSLPQVKIQRIEAVYNEYLAQAYEIRKFELTWYHGESCSTELIHATDSAKVKPILQNNLNWRLVMRSKYGIGVSFTDNAGYANRYCNNRNGASRAFIICDVLIGRERHVYESNEHHPPSNIDTYRSKNKFVWVKFDDFTFNPKFVIYYECPETAVPSRNLSAMTNMSSKRYGYRDRTEFPEYRVQTGRYSTPAIELTAAKRNEVRFVAGSGHPQTRPRSPRTKEYDDDINPVLFWFGVLMFVLRFILACIQSIVRRLTG